MALLEKAVEQLKNEGYTDEQIHKALELMLIKLSNEEEESR